VSALRPKITRLEDGDLYMTKILEAASKQLKHESLRALEYFCRRIYVLIEPPFV
jgi:hypothetical protein